VSELLVPHGPGWERVGDWVEPYRREGAAGLKLGNWMTRDEWNRWQRYQDSRFFLVRNRGGDTGERFRCSRHAYEPGISEPVYHEFMTLMCVDRPWRGLDGALYAYATITSDERLKSMILRDLPAANNAHPATFGNLTPNFDGEELIAVSLGIAEPITQAHAKRLADEINSRRPPKPFEL
jgi:hypothetical protein